jgi:hypothetical protein
MKKSLALVGAGTLGLVAGGAGVALPAQAAATEPCVDIADQLPDPTGNWYMDCIPQYGLGKAEFTIVADADDPTAEFPEGFQELGSDGVEVSTTADLDALDAYLGGGLDAPIVPAGSTVTASEQTYIATVVAPVVSVGAVTPDTTSEAVLEALADQCGFGDGVTYQGAWVATYGAVDTTFTQTVNGEEWTYVVEGTPRTTYFMASFDADGVDDTLPWCISDGEGSINNALLPDSDLADELFGLVYHGIPAGDEDFALPTFGVFGRFEPEPEPAALPAPQLAATGSSDPATPLIAGGLLALLGAAATVTTGILRRNKHA